MPSSSRHLPVLEYLQRQLDGTLTDGEHTHMRYPTAISRLLNFRITAIDEASATLELDADAALHGNQQGTVHGGLLCELADAVIEQLEIQTKYAGYIDKQQDDVARAATSAMSQTSNPGLEGVSR